MPVQFALTSCQVQPGALDRVEAAFADAWNPEHDDVRLLGTWRTDIGMLNQIMHFWSLGDAVQAHPSGCCYVSTLAPQTKPLIVKETCRALTAAPFSPSRIIVDSRMLHEIRIYRYQRDAIEQVIARWQRKVAARLALSAMLFCGYTECRPTSEWVHIWPYRDLLERQNIRAAAIQQGLWPPGAFEGLIDQKTLIVVPAKISPLA